MRRLYIKFMLWRNGYCTKHGIRKTYATYGFFADAVRCYMCAREEMIRARTDRKARETYLDKLLEEFNR